MTEFKDMAQYYISVSIYKSIEWEFAYVPHVQEYCTL